MLPVNAIAPTPTMPPHSVAAQPRHLSGIPNPPVAPFSPYGASTKPLSTAATAMNAASAAGAAAAAVGPVSAGGTVPPATMVRPPFGAVPAPGSAYANQPPYGSGSGGWGGPTPMGGTSGGGTETITVTNVVSAPAINKLGSLFSTLNKTVSGALSNFIAAQQQPQQPQQQEMTSHNLGGWNATGAPGGFQPFSSATLPHQTGSATGPGFSVFGQHLTMPPRGSMIAPADVGRPSTVVGDNLHGGVRPQPQVAWMQSSSADGKQPQQPGSVDPTNPNRAPLHVPSGSQFPAPPRDVPSASAHMIMPPSLSQQPTFVGHSSTSAFMPVGQGLAYNQQSGVRGAAPQQYQQLPPRSASADRDIDGRPVPPTSSAGLMAVPGTMQPSRSVSGQLVDIPPNIRFYPAGELSPVGGNY